MYEKYSLEEILKQLELLKKTIIGRVLHAFETYEHHEEKRSKTIQMYGSVTPLALLNGVIGIGEARLMEKEQGVYKYIHCKKEHKVNRSSR